MFIKDDYLESEVNCAFEDCLYRWCYDPKEDSMEPGEWFCATREYEGCPEEENEDE